MHVDETIAAIASAPQGGARGIVRVSGPETIHCLQPIFQEKNGLGPWTGLRQARRFVGVLSLHGPLGEVPCDLYLWPTERSYTRQPTAELHTFGGRPLLEAMVRAVCLQGARPARPGEFTLRAFLAGRIDLAQAEAVLGVIDAIDDRQLEIALSQLAGGLSGPLTELREALLNLCADLEAGLDFVDEDIAFIGRAELTRQLEAALVSIVAVQHQVHLRGTHDALPRVVLRGEPNVGKSALWNALLGDARAIVTDQAGTTRDYLCGTVSREHIAFTLIDTAGVDGAENDPLRQAMHDQSERQADYADLILLCIDSSRPLNRWETSELEKTPASQRLVVLTKSDLPRCSQPWVHADVETSAAAGHGIDDLLLRCGQRLQRWAEESTVVSSTVVRCREGLRLAGDSLQRGLELSLTEGGDELIAAELRDALDHLGQVVGAVYTDDVLDRVFSRFCIGK